MSGDRLNQFDLRLGKDFRLQRYRINASVDLYNVLNSDTVLNENGAYPPRGAGRSLSSGRFS